MKKWISLLIVFLLSFGFTVKPQPIEVRAATNPLTWTSYNLYSTFYELRSQEIYLNGSYYFEFVIPESTYHRYVIIGGSSANINLYDINDQEIDNIPLSWIRGFDIIGGTYFVDIAFHVGVHASLHHIIINIPQQYSSTPVYYVEQINAGSTYDPFPSTRIARFWMEDNTTPTGWVLHAESRFTNIPNRPTNPSKVDQTFIQWEYSYGGIYPFTTVFDQDTDNGVFNLYARFAPEYLAQYFNGLTLFEDDDWAYWDAPQYYPFRPLTEPTREGYTFIGWKTKTGEYFEFNRLPTVVEFDPLLEETFKLYASYQINSPSGTTYPPNTPSAITALATLLNNYGMYNFPALMFIYFVTMVLINGVLGYYMKVSALVHFIISIAVTILFGFMNLIPVYALIPIGLILIVGLIVSLNGNTLGGINE